MCVDLPPLQPNSSFCSTFTTTQCVVATRRTTDGCDLELCAPGTGGSHPRPSRAQPRREDLGRPYLYGTTRRFLQMFGLRSADRLPRIAWVNQGPLPLPTPEPADLDSESKESTVKKSFTAAALLERNAQIVDESLLEQPTFVPSAIEDEDDFDEDEDDDDDFDDDDDDWDDEDDDEEEEGEEDADADDLESEEDAEWEEVDDDDSDDEDLDDEDDEDEDDDWDDDEEDDDDEDWD